jgi:uncharacterized repeat protein (TIGR01451 family)
MPHLRSLGIAWLLAISPLPIAAQASPHLQPDSRPEVSRFDLTNQATYSYDGYTQPSSGNPSPSLSFQGVTGSVRSEVVQQRETVQGQLLGCAGEPLTDYTGFTIALYHADARDPTQSNLKALLTLTPTPATAVGLAPNLHNRNPFPLTTADRGRYHFQLNDRAQQLTAGRSYILVITPPTGSSYSQRRIKVTIGDRIGNLVSYRATALDGKSLNGSNDHATVAGGMQLQPAGSSPIAALSFRVSVCQFQEIQIIKSGDRAAAEPGDHVIYRLTVRNLASSPVTRLTIADQLPLGFAYRTDTAQAEFRGRFVPVTATQNGKTLRFEFSNFALPKATPAQATAQTQVLTIAYAAVLTPDAVRGTGRNSATVRGQRTDNQRSVKDGPATHQLRVRSGILTDCGTILGRVFVDKNFDGEQQPNEPGVPNAVVFLDDGNRIVTDANGLFSVANALPGYRTGVLDLSTVPGYTLAPNLHFSERNSQSRLVHLEPSGLVRMNFAVTPTFREASPRP